MEAETDNPILEPADVFYGAADKAEPKEPTEEADVTNGEDQTAGAEKPEVIDQDGGELDSPEESASKDEGGDTEDGEQELTYLDLDGKEVDLEEVRKWRDGHLMQADYTRKTTELAEERKATTSEREELKTARAEVANLKAEMQALIQEDGEVNWEELREYDPEKYIELKEKADKRKAAVAKLQGQSSNQPAITPEELAKEQKHLFAANPTWLDDKGQPTQAMQDDKVLIESYWKDAGFTAEETAGMSRSRYIETCLKAAKFDALQEKSKATAKKAKKATLVTKPKSQARKLKPKAEAIEDVFYKKVNS